MGYVEELRKIVGSRRIILVGAIVIIENEKNEILLQKRKEPYGVWGLPGGLMELGETVEENARREVYEECNILLKNLETFDIISGKENYMRASNGDEIAGVTVVYICKEFENNLESTNDEILANEFIHKSKLPSAIVGSHKKVINKYLNIE